MNNLQTEVFLTNLDRLKLDGRESGRFPKINQMK